MIKPIDKIPVSAKRKSQKHLIQEDIQQAMDEGIEFFEFVDEAYNKKYLKQYIREVAGEMVKVWLNKKTREYKNSGGEWPEHYFSIGWDMWGYLIKISSMKDENGELHVYGEICKNGLEEAWEKTLRRANVKIEQEKEFEKNFKKMERGCIE